MEECRMTKGGEGGEGGEMSFPRFLKPPCGFFFYPSLWTTLDNLGGIEVSAESVRIESKSRVARLIEILPSTERILGYPHEGN
jgi:hypothetical protein